MTTVITGAIFLLEIALLIYEPTVIKVVATAIAALAFGFCAGLEWATR